MDMDAQTSQRRRDHHHCEIEAWEEVEMRKIKADHSGGKANHMRRRIREKKNIFELGFCETNFRRTRGTHITSTASLERSRYQESTSIDRA